MSYYSDAVARGIEDYYAGRGEATGTWVGAGSEHEGLTGDVASEELARLFEGCHPASGERLGAEYKVRADADRVTGWDLTFSAPKSVSTLWAVGGGNVGMEVRDAHDAAVTSALSYLEEHAAFSRTGKAGVRQVDTHGLMAAAFVHRTSRAGDPQLHTHVLVSGRVRCTDGVWRALDSRALHHQLKPAGMTYHAALRAELSRRLGVEWTVVDRHGQAEIVGVPQRLRSHFAQRRNVVETKAAEMIGDLEGRLGRPLTPAERRQTFERATVDTRDRKDHAGETDGGLHDRWHKEAETLGHAPVSWLGDTVGRAHPSLAAVGVDDRVVAEIVAELARTSSTWRRADVTKAAASRVPTGVGNAEAARLMIETTVDKVLSDPKVVALTAPEAEVPAELRRRDGRSVFDRHDGLRYTTGPTLATEQRVLDLVDAGRGAGRCVASPIAVRMAVEGNGLDEDQAAAVRAVCGDGDTVTCVVGPAGAGKSRAMRAAAGAWGETGIGVRGLAVSAVAAGVLAEEAGIGADTIAKFLYEHDRLGGPNERWRLRNGEAVIVDEAGMVATADLAGLAVIADKARAKLVLVGDHAQLGAVEAGGMFRLLCELGAVELGGVRRFIHPWEADASLRLRSRDPAVLDVYESHGRIETVDRLDAETIAAEQWIKARAEGESLVVCATDNATVSDICDTVRSWRVAAGEVEPGGVSVSGHVIGVGDEIVTLRNNRALITTAGGWVRNGDRWTVTARQDDGALTVSHLGGHGRTNLPAEYVAEHVHLGYALTVHKAQGVTVDRSLLIVDETTTAEALYVGMTRGRHNNTALACVDMLDHEHPQPEIATRQLLTAALARSTSEQAAITVLKDTLTASESLATLAPRLASIQAQLQRETPDNPEVELQRLQARRSHLERRSQNPLSRTGRDTRRNLRDLDEQVAHLSAARDQRLQWFVDHAEMFAYRDELIDQVVARRRELGETAAAEQPAHLTRLLGPLPREDHQRQQWAERAGRIESYREEWGVHPDHLQQRPTDRTQELRWELTVGTEQRTQQLIALERQRAIDRTLGHDRGFGIEL